MNAIFTICAKNYLAQALTLKESVIKHNNNIDFFIFLSDLDDANGLPEDLILLNENWIPEWRKMALKYNVIEFSTSIKPFCFNKLINEGYEKIIYLDPDIYVTDTLDTIFNFLDTKSIVLSPHYCHIQENYTGSVPEEELLFVGIYNLGFCAIKNDNIGTKITNWWMDRLSHSCYADKWDALHVDQKWMDFIPGFFPEDTFITHHAGINPAIWNLHERALEINEAGKYLIKDLNTGEKYPLLFFHFSGFDPFNPTLVNRRHPKYNTEVFPSFKPLFKEYIDNEYKNEYNKYSKLKYSFNSFNNGENIIPLHRRLFRIYGKDLHCTNPFDQNEEFYTLLKKNKLLTGVQTSNFSSFTDNERNKKQGLEKAVIILMRTLKSLFGIKYYAAFLTFMQEFTRYENQNSIIKHGVK